MGSSSAKRKNNRAKIQNKAARRQRLIWLAVGALLFGGAVAMAVELAQPEAPPPPELEAVETFPDLGVQHLAVGEPAPVYNSDPPTSGPHSGVSARCGIYRQPVPDVNQLHSMEHGAVVVQYHPDLPEDQVRVLEAAARSVGSEIIVAPREGNPSPVALTAWTKRLLVDRADEDIVKAFAKEYRNRSPEGGAICPFEIDEGR